MTRLSVAESYAALPYESIPFSETHPGSLSVLGRLFGIDTAPVERCRYLEIGCAAGGNLLPLAWYHPNSHFVGIDLAANQIADGQRVIDAARIDNIRLEVADITHYRGEGKPFDYIVAHGLFSWVDDQVRDAILDACKRLLAPNGILYLSYNVLPGWRLRGMLRDMLRFTTRNDSSPVESVERSHDYLHWMSSALAGNTAFSARYLREESARLAESHPSYLYHEYLEADNTPYLFSDFIALTRERGFSYLCDTELATLFPETLDNAVAEALSLISDPMEREQYFDFLTTRHFRQSLLVHEQASVSEEWDLSLLEGYSFHGELHSLQRPDLRRAKGQTFSSRSGNHYTINHPLTKAALHILEEVYPSAIPYPQLLEQAAIRVRGAAGGEFAEQEGHLFGELFSLFIHQAIGVSTEASSLPDNQGLLPRLSPFSRALVDHGYPLVGVHHEAIQLDPFSSQLVSLLDGERDAEALSNDLLEAITDGRVVIPGVDPRKKGLAHRVEQNVEQLLRLFARQGVFWERG